MCFFAFQLKCHWGYILWCICQQCWQFGFKSHFCSNFHRITNCWQKSISWVGPQEVRDQICTGYCVCVVKWGLSILHRPCHGSHRQHSQPDALDTKDTSIRAIMLLQLSRLKPSVFRSLSERNRQRNSCRQFHSEQKQKNYKNIFEVHLLA